MNWLTGESLEKVLRDDRTENVMSSMANEIDKSIGGELWHVDCDGLDAFLTPESYDDYLLYRLFQNRANFWSLRVEGVYITFQDPPSTRMWS